jgi:hypothetical protein
VSVLAERLENMRVRVHVPGAGLEGELRGRTGVRISFEPGTYEFRTERDLERHLASLARLLWAGRMKEYYAALSEALGEQISGESPPISLRDQEYDGARDALVAEGRSADGRIYVSVRGMRDWTVRIAENTVRTLREDQFVAAVGEAAAALIQDQFAKIRRLKDEIYA